MVSLQMIQKSRTSSKGGSYFTFPQELIRFEEDKAELVEAAKMFCKKIGVESILLYETNHEMKL